MCSGGKYGCRNALFLCLWLCLLQQTAVEANGITGKHSWRELKDLKKNMSCFLWFNAKVTGFRGKQDHLTNRPWKDTIYKTIFWSTREVHQLRLLHEIVRTSLRSDIELHWLIDGEKSHSVVGGGKWSTCRPTIHPALRKWPRITRTHPEKEGGDGARIRFRRREVFGCGLGGRALSWEGQASEGLLQGAPRRCPDHDPTSLRCWEEILAR